MPGPEAGSHDDVYLTDLAEGWVEVESPATGLAFRLDFDAALFRWLISWQPYGGAEAMPLAGSVRPWHRAMGLAPRPRACGRGGGGAPARSRWPGPNHALRDHPRPVTQPKEDE